MSIKKKKACPEVQLIEAYISNQISFASESKNISRHIYSCPRCHALAAEFYQYYQILEQEIIKPVANSAFKLVNDIEKEKVIIAGILLQPGDRQENEQSLQYQAEIILINQNDDNSEIDDFDCIPIDDKEIFVRAVQSSQTSETTLFLFANDEKLYRNVRLQIVPGEETFLSDDIGIIRLGRFELNNLDEQLIIITPEN
jgi:hypothetical protein